MNFVERHLLVESSHIAADLVQDSGHGSARTHHDVHGAIPVLTKQIVGLRAGRRIQSELACVADHADDGVPIGIPWVEGPQVDSAPDRVFTGKQLPGHGGVDDRDVSGVPKIGRCKVAATDQRYAHGLKIAGRNHLPANGQPVLTDA
jgi:hypothetical protein